MKKGVLTTMWLFVSTMVLASSDSTAYNHHRLEEFRSIAFSKVKSISVAKIRDSGEKKSKGEGAKFHGYRVISEWRHVDERSGVVLVHTLGEILDSLIRAYAIAGGDDIVELRSFCIPHPGYAVHFESDRGARDFLICLECGQIEGYGEQKPGASFSLDSEQTEKLHTSYADELGGSR
jgi:hypothetical protein